MSVDGSLGSMERVHQFEVNNIAFTLYVTTTTTNLHEECMKVYVTKLVIMTTQEEAKLYSNLCIEIGVIQGTNSFENFV